VHIITIEDPIEYVFESKKSLIHQREISTHTQSFPRAIKSALREDPDVVVIGEMRDPETMAAAITLAETGHLVISTLHTNDTVQAIDRIVDSFPTGAQSQIRVQLALSLAGILSQSLLLKLKGTGRIAARELLVNNDAIRSLIVR
jgi:twitching motility protein PilT